MIWEYKNLGYTRKEAEEKILRVGFKIAEGRGYEIKLPKGNKMQAMRFHIVPSGDSFNLHLDSKKHKVVNGKKRLPYLQGIIRRLNKLTFREKIIKIIRSI